MYGVQIHPSNSHCQLLSPLLTHPSHWKVCKARALTKSCVVETIQLWELKVINFSHSAWAANSKSSSNPCNNSVLKVWSPYAHTVTVFSSVWKMKSIVSLQKASLVSSHVTNRLKTKSSSPVFRSQTHRCVILWRKNRLPQLLLLGKSSLWLSKVSYRVNTQLQTKNQHKLEYLLQKAWPCLLRLTKLWQTISNLIFNNMKEVKGKIISQQKEALNREEAVQLLWQKVFLILWLKEFPGRWADRLWVQLGLSISRTIWATDRTSLMW